MNKDSIEHAIEAFVRERFEVSPEDSEFSRDLHLFDYGYVDSFGAVELTQFVESRFGIEVRDTDFVVHPLNTVAEIAEYVVKRRQGLA